VRAPRRVPTSSRVQGRLPLATLAGELAEAYPDGRTDFAQSCDQWEASIRDGLRATHQRGDLRRPADPDRLATALFAFFSWAVEPPAASPRVSGLGATLLQHPETAPPQTSPKGDNDVPKMVSRGCPCRCWRIAPTVSAFAAGRGAQPIAAAPGQAGVLTALQGASW
jgi:hypothetical protein